MNSFRFLHAADLHIDSPLRGLEADPDAPADRIRTATRAAYTNLVDLALHEQVAFVLIAGDLFDGEWQDWRTGQFFAQETARLTRAGIRVFCIRGNHDAASVVTGRLVLPDGARMLRTDQPESIRLAELNVVIHGQSFASRNVPDDFVSGYPSPVAGLLNIGVLHTSAAPGDRGPHPKYAPCTVGQLVGHGYNYWALGHVHAREVLADSPCWIVFPGNIQGRDIGETGPKGATLVTVQDGQIVDVAHRDLDVVRWALLPVDLASAVTEDDALAAVRADLDTALDAAGDRLLAVRIVLQGATAAHPALVRDLGATRDKLHAEAAGCAGAGTIWLESVEVRTRPALDLAAMRARSDAVGLLVRELDNATSAHFAAEVQTYCATLLNRARLLRETLGDDHPAVQAAGGSLSPDLLESARNLLLARLAEG
ncbi:MAG TPA: DNA repair exonuclease [Acetobacteraceae bacterium]|nr:DNA repair exonuclease [Acetobacteraceae bacterium]